MLFMYSALVFRVGLSSYVAGRFVAKSSRSFPIWPTCFARSASFPSVATSPCIAALFVQCPMSLEPTIDKGV